MKSGENWQAVSEKTFKDLQNVIHGHSPGAWADNPHGIKFLSQLTGFNILIIPCQFQLLVFNIF